MFVCSFFFFLNKALSLTATLDKCLTTSEFNTVRELYATGRNNITSAMVTAEVWEHGNITNSQVKKLFWKMN